MIEIKILLISLSSQLDVAIISPGLVDRTQILHSSLFRDKLHHLVKHTLIMQLNWKSEPGLLDLRITSIWDLKVFIYSFNDFQRHFINVLGEMFNEKHFERGEERGISVKRVIYLLFLVDVVFGKLDCFIKQFSVHVWKNGRNSRLIDPEIPIYWWDIDWMVGRELFESADEIFGLHTGVFELIQIDS